MSVASIDVETEKALVERAIRDCIEWPFPEKDVERLYGSVAHEESFFIFHPDSKSTVTCYDEFKHMIKTVFLDDRLHPESTVIKDLRINLNPGADTAWFSCMLDDVGTFGDRKWEWLDCRWTGVLQKTDEGWKLFQMHFSLAKDD